MKMVCPIAKKCKRNDDGIGEHCGEHERVESCKHGADGCPPCVPVARRAARARLDAGKTLIVNFGRYKCSSKKGWQ